MELDASTSPPAGKVAVHLLPVDIGRGAQRYAMSLRAELVDGGWDHVIMVMFRGDRRAVDADESLDVPIGVLRRGGFDPRVLWRLRARLRRNPPDVVVAHGGEPFKYARFVVPPQTKLMYYRIGVSQGQATKGLRNSWTQWLARRADMVSGVSHETLDDSHDVMAVSRSRLRLVPNGRDPAPFHAARESAAASDDSRPHLIAVGHLSQGKRPDWFIDAVDQLRSTGRDVRATLIGDGPLLEALHGRARAADVAMLGHRDDIPDLLCSADVFCFPSSGESEGMPGVLIEAGLAGLATVATSVPGASTVIADGTTGYIVPIDDFDGFVDAITRLVDDPERCAEMGRAAIERCEAQFSLEASTTRFQQVLDELVTTTRPTS